MGAWLLSELEPQRLIDLGNQAAHIDLAGDSGGDQGGGLASGSRRSW